MAAAAGAAAAAEALTPTAAVRRALLQHGNKAQRLTSLYDQVKPQFADLTRTHFREKVVRQMFDRGEVVKYLITEEVRGRPRSVYGMRLKNNAANRRRAAEAGIVLHRSAGADAAAAAAAAPAAAGAATDAAPAAELR